MSRFFSHLAEVKMSYFQHLGRALKIGSTLMRAGTKTIIHGFYPDIFKDAASKETRQLFEKLHPGQICPGAQNGCSLRSRKAVRTLKEGVYRKKPG